MCVFASRLQNAATYPMVCAQPWSVWGRQSAILPSALPPPPRTASVPPKPSRPPLRSLRRECMYVGYAKQFTRQIEQNLIGAHTHTHTDCPADVVTSNSSSSCSNSETDVVGIVRFIFQFPSVNKTTSYITKNTRRYTLFALKYFSHLYITTQASLYL